MSFNDLEYYPPKPELLSKEKKGHISVTIFSMIIFALTFSFLLDDYVLILMLLLTLLIHELGHYLCMKLFGYESVNMLFIPFMGAMVQGKKDEYSQLQTAIMILAGPIPGIIFGALLIHYANGLEYGYMIFLGVFFILLNVFNLLPIGPLDGGQLIKVMFFRYNDFIQLVFTFIFSLLIIAAGWWFDSWLVIILGFFLGFSVKRLYKLYLIRKDLLKENVNYISTYAQLSDKTFAKLKEFVIKYTPVLKQIEEESPEDKYDQIIANQVDGVLVTPVRKDLGALLKLVFVLVWLGGFVLSFTAIKEIDFNALIYAFQSR